MFWIGFFFFVETVDNLLNSTNSHINVLTLQQKIDYCPSNIFLYPVTENEVENVTQSLQGNSSAGFEEIPEFLVKQCIHYIKNC